MTNKWTATDQPIAFEDRTYVIPKGTRISINGTGVHSNPKVWGDDATKWEPSRWIIAGGDGDGPLVTPQPSRSPSPLRRSRSVDVFQKEDTRPPSPSASSLSPLAAQLQQPLRSRPASSRSPSPGSAMAFGTMSQNGILKPANYRYIVRIHCLFYSTSLTNIHVPGVPR
jgi:hypothetical protein